MDQATIFQAGMSDIWGDDCHNLYDNWSNANECLKALGAKETGNVEREPQDEEDNPFVEWEMPDGSKVWVGRKGSKTSHVCD